MMPGTVPTYTDRIESCQSHMLREHLGLSVGSMCAAFLTEFHRGTPRWQVPLSPPWVLTFWELEGIPWKGGESFRMI